MLVDWSWGNNLTTYNLSYDDYLKEKELRFQQELAQFQKEEEEMERLRKFIEYLVNELNVPEDQVVNYIANVATYWL